MAPSLKTPTHSGPETSQIAVVMVPLPAQGHLNQLLHLSRLISAANLPVHFLSTTTHIRQARLRVHCWDPAAIANIRFHDFQTRTFETPPPDPNFHNKFPSQLVPVMFAAALDLRQPVFTFISHLSANFRRVVVVYDTLVSYVVQDVGSLPNVEPYCFRSVSASATYGLRWEFQGMPGHYPPGAEVLKEMPTSEGCFTDGFMDYVKLQDDAPEVFSGDIYNSSRAIEGLFLDLLQKEMKPGADRMWAVGPFNPIRIPNTHDPKNRHHCLKWLDRQDQDSVIFISFGTTTSVSDEQIKEIAIGLERSQQKFIWVVRDADKGNIFTNDHIRKAELPEGFEERTKDRGIIIRDWAPQLEILAHDSTGGFMSHCGWNSCMESISMGVPIATWPMHSDQPRNAALVTKVLKTGVEVKDWAHWDKIIDSDTVEKGVRKLMGSKEGKEIRNRAKELGRKVRESVMEGGSSNKDMESFILHITRPS